MYELIYKHLSALLISYPFAHPHSKRYVLVNTPYIRLIL